MLIDTYCVYYGIIYVSKLYLLSCTRWCNFFYFAVYG